MFRQLKLVTSCKHNAALYFYQSHFANVQSTINDYFY